VTICREWLLVKSERETMHAKLLLCRSWGCDHCGKIRQRQLIAKAKSGHPNRFLTLTISPYVGESVEDRRAMLSWALHIIVQRTRRLHPTVPLEYFAVVEATKRGEPHIHVLIRGPYMPQAQISAWMDELVGSPIVHIRAIDSEGEAAGYVAKYVGKEPDRFGDSKRYWCSRGWELEDAGDEYEPAPAGSPWHIDRRSLVEIFREWQSQGYKSRQDGKDRWIGFLSPPGSQTARSGLPRNEAET